MVSASSTDQTRNPPRHARFIEPKVHVARLWTETFSHTFGKKQKTWFCTNYLPLKELWRLDTADLRKDSLNRCTEKKIMKRQAKRFDKCKLPISLQQIQTLSNLYTVWYVLDVLGPPNWLPHPHSRCVKVFDIQLYLHLPCKTNSKYFSQETNEISSHLWTICWNMLVVEIDPFLHLPSPLLSRTI